MSKIIIFLSFIMIVTWRDNHRAALVIDLVHEDARAPLRSFNFFKDIKWRLNNLLTPISERQECLLGRLRRHQFIETDQVLNDTYNPTAIYVRSTNTRRALMSAQAYLVCFILQD